MNGADYIVAEGRGSLTAEGKVVAREGGTCERVPAKSLPWLAEQGIIVPRPKSIARPRRTTDVEEER